MFPCQLKSGQIGDIHSQATNLNNLGAIASFQGNLEVAVSYYTTSLNIRRRIEDYQGTARTLYNLSQIWSTLGDLSLAERLLAEAVELDTVFRFVHLKRDQQAMQELQTAIKQHKEKTQL